MKERFLIFLVCLLPEFLFGQECGHYNAIKERRIPIYCYLTPIKRTSGSVIAIITKDCDFYKFDSTANGKWEIYSFDTTTLMESVNLINGKRK